METKTHETTWTTVYNEGQVQERDADDFSTYTRTQYEIEGRTYDAERSTNEHTTTKRLWLYEGKVTSMDEDCWSLVWHDTVFN